LGDITLLLKRWSDGDEAAIEPLFELVYPDLRRIASAMIWNPGSEPLLQPTAVVNELYLRLVQIHSLLLDDRGHFFSLAARFMRRILVDSARHAGRQKRSHGIPVPLNDDLAWIDLQSEEMLDLDRAMEELEKIDKRKCRIVELRFFLGLTSAETAEFLEVSKATVERDYRFTLGWLYQRLRPDILPQ
jgi:RNA polymerase sigma factor (TIGR02999 family)